MEWICYKQDKEGPKKYTANGGGHQQAKKIDLSLVAAALCGLDPGVAGPRMLPEAFLGPPALCSKNYPNPLLRSLHAPVKPPCPDFMTACKENSKEGNYLLLAGRTGKQMVVGHCARLSQRHPESATPQTSRCLPLMPPAGGGGHMEGPAVTGICWPVLLLQS